MSYYSYTVVTEPCDNCRPCPEHLNTVPHVVVKRRYWFSDEEGHTEITEEEYDRARAAAGLIDPDVNRS
ncbi:hypothetical protein [Streptomyces microflavus]|uniref:hypothetical protein n=1 Tax=Streptomyces microflavus TaxID=1919 RepID=UPI003692C570